MKKIINKTILKVLIKKGSLGSKFQKSKIWLSQDLYKNFPEYTKVTITLYIILKNTVWGFFKYIVFYSNLIFLRKLITNLS